MQEERMLGNLLVRQGVVSPDALEALFSQQREKGISLGDLLVQSKLASEVDLARALAAECRLPFAERIDNDVVQANLAGRVPIGYAKNHLILVTEERDDAVNVVCADPLGVDAVDGVRAIFKKPVQLTVAPSSVVLDAINRVYERQETMSELKSDEGIVDDGEQDILDSDDDAPIIRWVNALFSQAVKERASDIHIEPEDREVLVRYRVDGRLFIAKRASRQFMSSVVARVKIM
ncbi:MAG TPA: ATPase, T2SS/T4P/T4SS family, partial [Polyangiaceae bacterium]|nr:ATPase, T2SS/T4P/T4SS family [Polyangiaceae bacterium]